LTGDHAQVARWRLQQRLGLTYRKRPDLFAQYALNKHEQQLLDEFLKE
jgi:tRNA (guanine37-N1)-methyltransferase